MTDSVLKLVAEHQAPDNEQFISLALKFAGVSAGTPPDRIARAAGEEVADLIRRARAGLAGLGALSSDPAARESLDALKADDAFPRDQLDAIAASVRANAGPETVAVEIDKWTGLHKALEHRLTWLLRGTPPKRREGLDPLADADQLHHILTNAFRFEARVLEMLAINRVAQSPSIGTFFRSTKEAEGNAVMRFFDTYALYGNVFEWGVDSFRGRGAIERMNQIHGRYYIPNDEMKFVLLQGCFTWLDGVDRIGHRPVTNVERRGMLASWVRMGRAMNMQDLSEDYDAMYGWYREVCAATAEFKPYKRATFETIIGASVDGQPPPLRDGLLMAAQVAMDDTYRSATGFPAPSKEQHQAVRAVFFTVGSFIEQLPYTPYLRSLANNPVRRAWTDPKDLGAPDRSRYMPAAFASLPNGGLPLGQKPLQSPAEAEAVELPEITWEEVRKKADEGLAWVVVNGIVYDVTVMRDVHPGGAAILKRWTGKDATRVFQKANHSNGAQVFSLNFRIGRVVGAPPPMTEPEPDAATAAGV